MEDLAVACVPNRPLRSVGVGASGRLRLSALAVLALAMSICLLALALPLRASASMSGLSHGYAEAVEACPQSQPGFDQCFALVRKPVAQPAVGAAKPGVRPFVVGAGAASAGPAGGLTPEDLASAYGYTPTSGGSGETVAIVDAFDDPSISSDLGEFDTHYNLPTCTTTNGCLTKVGQSGGALPAADTSGWSVEISLDVETVHAACPNCHILLVESNNNSEENLAIATNEAVALGASVVSNSYGGPESSDGTFERSAYNHPGIPIVASTGDGGYYNWLDFKAAFQMANAPASLPSAIAVGGTTLTLNPDGTRASETVWSGAGGGCSKLFEAQPWQRDVAGYAATGCGTKRLSADVSAVADPNTGLDIFDTYDCGTECEGHDDGWETVGGTSLSAPFIASMYALAGGGHGLPDPSVTLYGQGSHFDVTEGGNGFCEGEACEGANSLGLGRIDCEGTTECDAGPGYDGPSGVGTPDGLGLFEPEPPSASISAPGSLTTGSAASFSAVGFSDPYPGGSIGSASWSWGDGGVGSGVTASHVYASPGSYTVTLTVTDSYGVQAASTTTNVEVAAASHVTEDVGGGTGPTPAAGVGTVSSTGGSQGVASFKATATAQPSAHLASSSLKVSAGKVKLTIVCAASSGGCSGTITLSAPATGHASAAKAKTLGKASFTVAAGKTLTITLHLSGQALVQLARSHSLHATATIALRAGSGAAQTAHSAVTLRQALTARRSG
jgi:hypothetical protein